jgi:hypothetical protein
MSERQTERKRRARRANVSKGSSNIRHGNSMQW